VHLTSGRWEIPAKVIPHIFQPFIAPVPGGMLHLGIPEYRLPCDVLQAQIREILDLGPKLVLNTRLGKDFSLADLTAQGFKAILLAIGLH